MNDVAEIIACLEKTPVLLKNLLAQVPRERLKERRIPGKWSIHEHACHVAAGDQAGFLERWWKFQREERPAFVPLSGASYPPDHFLRMELDHVLISFFDTRAELARLARAADDAFWSRQADHPEYEMYTPYIMLRHRLMHDHFHLYRIEELWLTRDGQPPIPKK
jgi:hypothetical protein